MLSAGPEATTPSASRNLPSALVWALVAIAAKAPFVARIEGALDHDQSVVGLMALDIAAGRRLPIFFDGQRYMGAIEAYLAAASVLIFGHSPVSVALVPLLFFGAFAAGQFAVWSRWRGRATGHLAAVLTVVGSPMIGLWGIVPRGGYVEFLAWALPTLWAYREVARPGRPALSAARQTAWGFWLALGYFVNPLSMTVYVTIALDWTFGRHGRDLRRERAPRSAWLDAPAAPAVGLAVGVIWVSALAACCHVDPFVAAGSLPYVALLGLGHSPSDLVVGAAGVLALLGAAAWWTRAPVRFYEALKSQPAAVAGLLAAWSPFVFHSLLEKAGVYPPTASLPIWIAAPWKAGRNLRTLTQALGPLIGCDPCALETIFIGQGVMPPSPSWPIAAEALIGLSPWIVFIALAVIVSAACTERRLWADLFALRRDDVGPPRALAFLFLAVTVALYSIQGTSPNASSIRYLVPVWVVVPGLLACGLRAVPRRFGVAAGLMIAGSWALASCLVWTDLGRPSPARPLADELTHRGVPAIVAATPVALVVANLSHGTVGAVEYQAVWPRLGTRYTGRLPSTGPIVCVTDRQFPWSIRGEGDWATRLDLGRHLRALAARHPGLVQVTWSVGTFDVWEADLALDEILAAEPDDVLPPIATASQVRPAP